MEKTFKAVLARKKEFVGGMLCHGNTPIAQIKSMQGLFGKGVLINFRDEAGQIGKLKLSDKDARVTLNRAGRIRIDFRGPSGAYVALVPASHPRSQAA